MVLAVVCFVVFVLAYVEARAIPQAAPQVDPKVAEKGYGHLLDGLKGIEQWRHAVLAAARENPKFKESAHLAETLVLLGQVDSFLVEARNYYDAINMLLHSGEDSTKAQEAVAAMKTCRLKLKAITEMVKGRAKTFISQKDVTKDTGAYAEMSLIKAAFDATVAEGSAIEAQLRDWVVGSPNAKYLNEIKPI